MRVAMKTGFLLLLMMGLLGLPAFSQEVTGSIVGNVVDPSGAPIKGATVTAKDTDRGTVLSAQTNDQGAFNITRVPVARYEVSASAQGFQTQVHPPFTLVLNQAAQIEFQMRVGQVTETVNVNSEAPVLQTQTTELSTVIDARANEALPLATRNYNQLTLLAPGAVSTNPGAFSGAQATFQVGRPYINGNREQTNNYILDGLDNNQIDNNDVAYAPNVDAIQEFNLITQNASAEFGNYLGGVINTSIKSGTNQYHGDVFEFLRNDVLNANTWANGLTKGQPFVPGQNNRDGTGIKPKLRWNEFGGTFGGPILKNKLFFFADYQGSRFDQPATSTPYTVFTTKERTGDFSEFCPEGFTAGLCNNPIHQLFNPFSSATPAGRQPFMNNLIPSGLFSHAASGILNSPLYPAPINGLLTGNQINVVHQNTNTDQGDLKIDWVPSDKNHFYGRYSQQYASNPQTNSQLLTGDALNTFPLKNIVGDYTRVFNPSLVNDARVGVNYFPVTLGVSNPTGQNLAQQFGIAGVPDTLLPQMNISGGFVNTAGNGLGNNDAKNTFADTVIQATDTLTWTHGNHVFHTGFQAFRYRTNIFYPGNEGLAGQFFFNGQFTGNPSIKGANGIGEADFLLGLPDQIGLGAGVGNRYLNNSIFAAFGQDDWRIRPNLTLNLGLRYEVNTPRADTQHRETNYGITSGQVEIAGLNGNSDALYNQYNGITNFQPRIGIAWQPSALQNTVIRAAYGISNFAESTGTNNLLIQNPPFTIPHNVNYVGLNQPTTTLDQGFSAFPASGCDIPAALASSPACFNGAGIHLFNPDFRPAVSQQWNLSIQRQFGNSTTLQLGYVGQKTDHLVDIFLLNQLVLNPDGSLATSPFLAGNPNLHQDTVNPALDPFKVGQARLTDSSGLSNYHALQIVLQQRLNRGLQFQANYTWSKCMTDTSGFFAEFGDTNAGLTQAGNDYFFFQNTYNPKADYGLCPNDIRHQFNGYVTYDLPFGHGRQFGNNINPVVNAVLGDWQINSIFQFHTGFAITAQAPDKTGTGSGFPRADCNGQPGTIDKFVTGGIQFLDPSSVSTPPAGSFGNCSVGSFRGPSLTEADLSLIKGFPITERQSLEFRAEALNFTNTPILAAPGDRVGPTFGLITQAQGSRQIQFGLKYHF